MNKATFSLLSADTWKKYWHIILLAVGLFFFFPVISKWGLERVGILSAKAEGSLIVKEDGKERSRSTFVSCLADPSIMLITQTGETIYVSPIDPRSGDKSSSVPFYSTKDNSLPLRSCQITSYKMDSGYPILAFLIINFFNQTPPGRDHGYRYWSGNIAGSCTVESRNQEIEFSATFKNCHPSK